METIGEVINEILKVRDTLDGIEVKGKQNAALLCYAYDHCNAIANALAEAAQNIQNGSAVTEDGEENGQ